MYNKSNKGSRLINILVGIIAVLIIIFLIVFLVNKNNGNKAIENEQQFSDNLSQLHQTAKEFFASQLPDEVGGTLQTSLQELIEMGAIDDLEYGNEKCDADESYISITKTSDSEYRVKSNLVCPGKSDSTVEKIKSSTTVKDEDGSTVIDEDEDEVDLDVQKDNASGSDSTVYCKDFKCTVEEIPTTCTVTYEYEYVKRSVSCPNGYNISGSVCTMESSSAIAPTPLYSDPTTRVENAKVNKGEPYKVYIDPVIETTDGEYSCEEGTLIGDKCIVYKDKVVTYETMCPPGYTKVGDSCYLYANKSKGSATSYCPAGYTDNGSNCYIKVAATKNTTTSCPSGYSQAGNYCYKYANKNTSTTSSCPSGYTQSGNYCYKYANKNTSTTSSCPSGYTQSGNYCYKYANKNTTSTASCPSGYTDNGSNCYIRQALQTSTSTSCPSGYTQSGNYCYKYANKTTSSSSSCPAGTTPNGNRCVKKVSAVKTYSGWGNPVRTYSSHTQESTYTYELEKKVLLGKNKIGVSYVYNYAIYRRTTYYTCSQGTLSGTTCLVYSNPTTTSKASCPSGYTDNGSNCYIREAVKTSTSSKCPSGYTQNGNYCYKYANKTTNSKSSCPSGYTDNGSNCYIRQTLQTSTTSKCPSGYTDNGSNCYIRQALQTSTTSKCPSGYTDNGSNCYIRQAVKTSTETSCNPGYTKNGDYCYAYADKITSSTPGTCPSGFTDAGSTCYKQTAGTPQKRESCPDGYTDNGSNCAKTENAKYEGGTQYNRCPDGYTSEYPEDMSFIQSLFVNPYLKCYKYETSEDKYYCENANAELKGTLCYVKEESQFLENRCDYGYTLGADNMCHSSSVLTANPTWTDVDYLFSTDSYVPGYQRTGRGKFHQVCVRANGTTEEKHWK